MSKDELHLESNPMSMTFIRAEPGLKIRVTVPGYFDEDGFSVGTNEVDFDLTANQVAQLKEVIGG